MTLIKSRAPKVSRSTAVETPAAPAAPRKQASELLTIGGSPRAHLLPVEVVERKKARALRRKLAGVLLVLIVAIAGGVGLASVALIGAQGALSTAQGESATLGQQRLKYSAITKVQSDVKAIEASQKVATAQEILWAPYIKKLQGTLPAGMRIAAFTAAIQPPASAGSVQTSDPLQGPRIASVTVTVTSPQASIAGWLTKLPVLPGFVDAEPTSVSLAQSGDAYTVVVAIHVNEQALSKRFDSKK